MYESYISLHSQIHTLMIMKPFILEKTYILYLWYLYCMCMIVYIVCVWYLYCMYMVLILYVYGTYIVRINTYLLAW